MKTETKVGLTALNRAYLQGKISQETNYNARLDLVLRDSTINHTTLFKSVIDEPASYEPYIVQVMKGGSND